MPDHRSGVHLLGRRGRCVAADARWYAESEIPWKDLAFRTVALTLRHWFADRAKGRFTFHAEDLPPN